MRRTVGEFLWQNIRTYSNTKGTTHILLAVAYIAPPYPLSRHLLFHSFSFFYMLAGRLHCLATFLSAFCVALHQYAAINNGPLLHSNAGEIPKRNTNSFIKQMLTTASVCVCVCKRRKPISILITLDMCPSKPAVEPQHLTVHIISTFQNPLHFYQRTSNTQRGRNKERLINSNFEYYHWSVIYDLGILKHFGNPSITIIPGLAWNEFVWCSRLTCFGCYGGKMYI